jgi:hypothetical protein
LEQGSIYFEFEPFDNSNGACPIIQYKVKDVVITETNHAAHTPNHMYGRDASGDYVYEMSKTSPGYTSSTCSQAVTGNSNCDRAQPVNTNNSQTFGASNSAVGNIFTTAFSPDDVAQYPDEQQTTLKREFAVLGTPYGGPAYTDRPSADYYNADAREDDTTYADLSLTGVPEYIGTYVDGGQAVGGQTVDQYRKESRKVKHVEDPATGTESGALYEMPFRYDSQVLHVLDCTKRAQEISACVRPCEEKYESQTDATQATDPASRSEQCYNPTRNEQSFVPIYTDSTKTVVSKYRLYLYETRIIQKITFRIEAMAEGGQRFETSDLILNVTCPGHVTVAAPSLADHGVAGVSSPVTVYIGGRDAGAEYIFPSFYPTFEYCNFITGYRIASGGLDTSFNNSIANGFDFTSIQSPDSMVLTDAPSTTRLPFNRQTIQVNTDCARDYYYLIIIEVKLTKTTWAEYIYSVADADPDDGSSNSLFQIQVVQGTDGDPSKISAPDSLFPSELG